MLDEDGEEDESKPRWVHEEFKFYSLDKDLAISTKRYMAIDPTLSKDGSWPDLLGMPCMITVVHGHGKGKNEGVVYENIGGVSTITAKAASKLPPLKNSPSVFDFDDPDMEVFGSMPSWVSDKIKLALNYKGSTLQKMVEGTSSGEEGDKVKEETKEEVNDDSGW